MPVVLYWDNFSAHMDDNLEAHLKEHNVHIIPLLANATHLLQPLDICIFGPFKLEVNKVTFPFSLSLSPFSFPSF